MMNRPDQRINSVVMDQMTENASMKDRTIIFTQMMDECDFKGFIGFKLVDVEVPEEENTYLIFENDHGVRRQMGITEDGVFFCEPYAAEMDMVGRL